MALVKKAAMKANNGAAHHAVIAKHAEANEEALAESTSRLAVEAQKRKTRTFARQQKAAERIAAATSELASGITEAGVGSRGTAQGRRADRKRCGRSRRSCAGIAESGQSRLGSHPEGEGKRRDRRNQD